MAENEASIKMCVIIAMVVFFILICYIVLRTFFIKPSAPQKKDLVNNRVISKENEVYNVGNNVFTYNEAELVCKAYNGELATVEQVKHAYDKGASWCNYGWTKGQYALFPMQKDSWDKLKEEKKTECGKPGLNGGYFPDKEFRIGVNCYGMKPEPDADEQALLHLSNYMGREESPTQLSEEIKNETIHALRIRTKTKENE